MKLRQSQKWVATISYIGCILFLNILLVRLPYVHSFGEQFSPADILVGMIYIVRDFAQREIKHYIILAMMIGATLSYFFSTPNIALASLGSFVSGEVLDWLIFTFTRKPLSQRLILSSVISTPIDSIVFLQLSNRLNWLPFIIMSAGKCVGIFILCSLWLWRQNKKTSAII